MPTDPALQPGNGAAILYSLMHLRELDPRAVVGFFPTYHHFADDEAFNAHVDSAFAAAESPSGLVVLLGIAPIGPEVEYGWIEPGAPLADLSFRYHLPSQPFLGEALPHTRLCLNGARLFLEQLRHGRTG
jgi:mannose-1-phosphate guanylyltransferase